MGGRERPCQVARVVDRVTWHGLSGFLVAIESKSGLNPPIVTEEDRLAFIKDSNREPMIVVMVEVRKAGAKTLVGS